MGRGVGRGVGRGEGLGENCGLLSVVAGVGRGRGRKGRGVMRGRAAGVVGAGVVGAGVVGAGVVGVMVKRENKDGFSEDKAGLTEVSGGKVVKRPSSSGSKSSGSSSAAVLKVTGLVSGKSGNSVTIGVRGASSSRRVGRWATCTRGRRGRSRVSGRCVSGSVGATVVVVPRARKKFRGGVGWRGARVGTRILGSGRVTSSTYTTRGWGRAH